MPRGCAPTGTDVTWIGCAVETRGEEATGRTGGKAEMHAASHFDPGVADRPLRMMRELPLLATEEPRTGVGGAILSPLGSVEFEGEAHEHVDLVLRRLESVALRSADLDGRAGP